MKKQRNKIRFVQKNPPAAGGDAGELTVTDLTGRSVFVRQFIDEGTRTEVTQPLGPGVYLVRIKTDKGVVLTEKLVVQSR